ncbi:MAG: DHHA1 domain-containing protein, partial [Chloroflexota bacterium]
IMEEGQEESRGSCRSIPEFDITAALDQCADLLVRHGGHAQAAGFTIRNENIPAFKERLMAITSAALSGKELLPKLEIDAEVDPAQLRLELAEELACLEPTGQSNPAPVFKTSGLQIRQKRTVGQDDRHLKLLLSRNGGPPIDAIGFNLGDRMPVLTDCVDVAYLLGVNEYNGRRTVQLVLQDVRPAGEEA